MGFKFRQRLSTSSYGNIYVNETESLIPDLTKDDVDWFAGWCNYSGLGTYTWSYTLSFGYANSPTPSSVNDIKWVINNLRNS